MTRIGLTTTIVLLVLTTDVTCQFVDFFNAFLQPYQNVRPNTVTKRPTNKQTRRYEDSIFQNVGYTERTRNLDPFGFYTTSKPRKTTRKSTTKTSHPNTTEKNKNNALINTNIHFVDNRNNNRRTDNVNNNRQNNNNNRRTDNNNNRKVINNDEYLNQNNNRDRTTKRPYSSNLSTNNYQSNYDSFTTQNPLLNRPGVKPAVVDENRPPITNRPVTKRPIYFPNEGPKWPDTTKAPEQDNNRNNNWSNNQNNNNKPGDDGGDEEPEIEIGPDEDDMSDAEKRRYLQMAEQKCEEYKSMNVKKVVALPLSPSNHGVEVNVSTCAPTNVPLIIGGKVVSINEFPHMGLVGWKKIQKPGYSWKCGGSLISEQYILTAGHCTYHDKDYNVVSGPPQAVQLGSSYLDDQYATVVSVAAVIRHAKYKLRRSYHDVALIRLTTTVTFSEVISPACLGVPPRVGEPIIATGWGKTEFGGDSSYELRSVSIPIWDMGDCKEIWGTSRKLPSGVSPDSQLCAGDRRGGKDTCQGDSGGPAQVQDGCVWRVVAVTSVGRSCGAPDTPALYAKLPRAFIASQAFINVKINNDNQYNGNNNQYNGNINQGSNTNPNPNRHNGNNNQNSANNNRYNENNNHNVNVQYNGASIPHIGTDSGYSNTNNNNNRYNENNNQYNGDSNYNTGSDRNNNRNQNNNYNTNDYTNNYNNRNDVIRPVVNYDNQYYDNNQNNNYYNPSDYNTYTTHNYNEYNNRNSHYESPIINTYNGNNNNAFPVISSKPWWRV